MIWPLLLVAIFLALAGLWLDWPVIFGAILTALFGLWLALSTAHRRTREHQLRRQTMPRHPSAGGWE